MDFAHDVILKQESSEQRQFPEDQRSQPLGGGQMHNSSPNKLHLALRTDLKNQTHKNTAVDKIHKQLIWYKIQLLKDRDYSVAVKVNTHTMRWWQYTDNTVGFVTGIISRATLNLAEKTMIAFVLLFFFWLDSIDLARNVTVHWIPPLHHPPLGSFLPEGHDLMSPSALIGTEDHRPTNWLKPLLGKPEETLKVLILWSYMSLDMKRNDESHNVLEGEKN